MSRFRVKLRLGEILVLAGHVSKVHRDLGLRMQKSLRLPIGEALIRLGFASEEMVLQARSKQMGVPYASPDNRVLPPDRDVRLRIMIPEELARGRRIVPLFLDAGGLALAAEDPADEIFRQGLQRRLGLPVRVFLTGRRHVDEAIEALYLKDEAGGGRDRGDDQLGPAAGHAIVGQALEPGDGSGGGQGH